MRDTVDHAGGIKARTEGAEDEKEGQRWVEEGHGQDESGG